MPEEEPQVPWDTEASPEWRETVNAWSWKPLGDGDWAKSGTCLAVIMGSQ